MRWQDEWLIQRRINQVLWKLLGWFYAQFFQHFCLTDYIASTTGKFVICPIVGLLRLLQPVAEGIQVFHKTGQLVVEFGTATGDVLRVAILLFLPDRKSTRLNSSHSSIS